MSNNLHYSPKPGDKLTLCLTNQVERSSFKYSYVLIYLCTSISFDILVDASYLWRTAQLPEGQRRAVQKCLPPVQECLQDCVCTLLRPEHISCNKDYCTENLTLSHWQHFKSSQGVEPNITRCTGHVNRPAVVDYIWWWSEGQALELDAVLPTPSDAVVLHERGMPSSLFPSDHLPLAARFRWKPEPTTTSTTTTTMGIVKGAFSQDSMPVKVNVILRSGGGKGYGPNTPFVIIMMLFVFVAYYSLLFSWFSKVYN